MVVGMGSSFRSERTQRGQRTPKANPVVGFSLAQFCHGISVPRVFFVRPSWLRVFVVAFVFVSVLSLVVPDAAAVADGRNVNVFSDRYQMQIENIAVPVLNRVEQRVGWRPIEVDARDGGLRPFENHVLGFLDV